MKNMSRGNGVSICDAVHQGNGAGLQMPAEERIGGSNGQQFKGTGDCLLLSSAPDGSITLSADAAASLVYMIEEEKMARDLYDAFFSAIGSTIFDRISVSEQKHMDTLLAVADKAGIDVSGLSTTAGVFTNSDIQALYDSLLQQGSASLDAAYGVGVLVEQTDIADIQAIIASGDVGIVGIVYSNLINASEHHLAAFTTYADLV